MRLLVILGVVAACRVPDEQFVIGDASQDSGSCAWPFFPSNFDPCAGDFPPSNGPGGLDGMTDIDSLGVAYHGLRLLHVDRLTVTTAVTLTGTQPLLIVSDGDVMISGSVDLSRLAPVGANCNVAMGADGAVTGGGPGGGLGFDGGVGGAGGLGGMITVGGHFTGDAALIPLVMGCGGGSSPGAAGTPGVAGTAGGAIEISSRTAVTITGAIISDGGGGGGGPLKSNNAGGGGGGGSGGAIALEAQSLVLAMGAQLCAVGGAGGEGASKDVNATPGHAGGTGTGCVPGMPVSTSFAGGDGGAGSAGVGGAGGDGSSNAGGGGGGGGGIIRIAGHMTLQNLGATIQPPATM